MKKLFVIITILLNVNMHALAYDFQSENLLYTILSSNPPTVRLDGHLYGHGVYGDLIIPEEVTFEDVTYKVIAIRNDAFYEYNHLTKISIPSSIQEIGITAFAYCSSVKELYYNAKNCPDVEDFYYFPFYECTGHLIIGDSVDRVPMNMFRQSFIDQLTIIGNSNTVIGECAFHYCNKLSGKLSLGKVAHIEAGAFWIGATNITSITIDREQPPTVGVYAFHSINKTIPVNVPCGSIELYQNAEQWNEFTNFANHLIYSVQAVSEDENKGVVDLIKTPTSCNDLIVEISAIPYDGYEFLRWEIDGDTVSTENPYLFELDRDVSLIARFRVRPDTLLLPNSEWYYVIQNDNGSTTYQHLECAADTTINNERPKIIIRSNTHYDREGQTEVTHEYVYEENGVVYWWNKDLEEFTILYDLAAEVGDEWTIKVGLDSITVHVDTVENLEYEGKTYRTLRVSDADDLFSGDIVSGVGHLASFFPEKLMTRGKDYRVEGLRCYWLDDELIYKLGDEDCDAIYAELHNGVDEPTDGAAFVVYPNPADGVLFVETQRIASQPDQTYRITNLMGQTVLQGRIIAEKQQINIESLPAGMYFITVGETTQKFIVQ